LRVRNQVIMAPSGKIIGLNYGTALDVIKLYTEDVKETFESILVCYEIEQEFSK